VLYTVYDVSRLRDTRSRIFNDYVVGAGGGGGEMFKNLKKKFLLILQKMVF
jgi:hypothetical protein